MSAESGKPLGDKAVDRYEVSNWGSYPMRKDPNGEYVEYEDYAKLEQQRAALVEALKEARDVIAEFGEYAPEYHIQRDLVKIDAALRAARVATEGGLEESL